MNDEIKPEDDAGKHQPEQKQHFRGFQNWRKKYWGSAWENAKKEARKAKFWVEFVGVVVLFVYTIFSGLMWWQTKENASWTSTQAKDIFNDHRPLIWVKIPDSMHVEVGKPINPEIQIFNYGKAPGIARARIRFEAGPGVIEKFRDILQYHQETFTLPIPEQNGTLKVLINPDSGKSFPIETPQLILSKQDMEKLAAGTIDVAIYGRIFYTNLSNNIWGKPNNSFQSSFCYYVMRDGSTTSACPNQEGKYTNWAP